MSWNSENKQKLVVFTGHEGSIVSLAVESSLLASGSSDATTRLWNKLNGQQLRVLYGHTRSVLTIELGATWMVTGSADGEVYVWTVLQKNKFTANAECNYKLKGHHTAVTSVKYGKMEVVSGDNKGKIFIWWLQTGKILRECKAHEGAVKCLQFDALHIVSGGVDNTICIIDIATGEILQRLHGHTGHVLGLAFDTERILSVSADNTIRYWSWGKNNGPQDKYHIFDAKQETLLKVSKTYNITMDELMQWNGIFEIKNVYQGMKLLVRKGDPTKLTDAERFIRDRDLRKLLDSQMKEKKKKNLATIAEEDGQSLDCGMITKYDRVKKFALDGDTYSLGFFLFLIYMHSIYEL
jgi:hypothetical protein